MKIGPFWPIFVKIHENWPIWANFREFSRKLAFFGAARSSAFVHVCGALRAFSGAIWAAATPILAELATPAPPNAESERRR